QMLERIKGGQKRHRNRGGGSELEASRQRRHRPRGDRHMRGESLRRERNDGTPRRKLADRGADRTHNAGAFKAERWSGKAALQSLIGQETEAPHDVAEVESRGRDLDLDLVR